MGEKISIITISYNSEKTIEKTIKSVLSQSYRPLEYIFVDGASKDWTTNIIKSYIPEFEKAGIEVQFKSESDKGISDAFNKGIEMATGGIIGIINSDDQLIDNVIIDIAKAFSDNIDVVCGDCLWFDKKNNLKYVRKSKLDLNKLKYEMVLMHPTCFVRKTAYQKWGVFDIELKYVMDKDLMARFYRSGAQFKYIPVVVTAMSAGGASDANAAAVFNEGVIVATRNGVPKLIAVFRGYYKMLRLKLVNWIKCNEKLWNIIKG